MIDFHVSFEWWNYVWKALTEWVNEFSAANGRSPTYDEIKNHLQEMNDAKYEQIH